ncbi:hypothetical protein LSH36_1591g00012 [Paralvinella palmiformis]|uniref:Palmitoyltransferase n=1 Tax=Paralvinella palmiformis TaxID=53620 RepID=A0AAD9ISI8_9ANNE|nr:hypothetical protein LSH36_1591g00012 [Paralvinella palmiformis]
MSSSSKRFWPKKLSDWGAFIFVQSGIHLVGFYELLVILPYIDSDRSNTFWFHVCFGLCLYFNTISSFILVMRTDTTTSRDGVIMPSTLKPGWRFCSSCEANSPPRAYHCWCCDICILRRDHHCVFTGNCVGFANHRYFILLIFYIMVGALYCNYLNMDYTLEVLGGFGLKTVFTMFMPLFSWMLGLTQTFNFLVAFVSALCLFGFLLAAGLLFYHLINIYHGQTTYERGQNIREWDCGWKQNVRQVLGERWYLIWISPWIKSPQGGDGINFPKRGIFEDVKDL